MVMNCEEFVYDICFIVITDASQSKDYLCGKKAQNKNLTDVDYSAGFTFQISLLI